jgi:hypothetical protein
MISRFFQGEWAVWPGLLMTIAVIGVGFAFAYA